VIEAHELESLLSGIGEGSKLGDGARRYLSAMGKED